MEGAHALFLGANLIGVSKVLYLSQDPVFPAITKGVSTCVYIISAMILVSKALPELYCAQVNNRCSENILLFLLSI